jgi:hypothetical protein
MNRGNRELNHAIQLAAVTQIGTVRNLCKWRDLRVRDCVSWAGEDHGHDEGMDGRRDWAGACGSGIAG